MTELVNNVNIITNQQQHYNENSSESVCITNHNFINNIKDVYEVQPGTMGYSIFINKYSRIKYFIDNPDYDKDQPISNTNQKEIPVYQTWKERITDVVEGNFSLDFRLKDYVFFNNKFNYDAFLYEISKHTQMVQKPTGLWADKTFSSNYIKSILDKKLIDEYIDTLRLSQQGVMVYAGRHLQHGDRGQRNKLGEFYLNCASSMFSYLTFFLLGKGSGVGRDYSSDICWVDWDYMPECRFVLEGPDQWGLGGHPDYEPWIESLQEARHKYDSESEKVRWFEVEDSLEGWVKVITILETASFHKNNKNHLFIFDFSKIRGKGQPIRGQQNRPSSGPVPFIQALIKCCSIKNAGMKPWKQAMFIDDYLASAIVIGGIRRASRISTKYWKDSDIIEFADIKREGFLRSANNSIMVDAEFWELLKDPENRKPWAVHARRVFAAATEAAYHDKTGEPGLINVDQLTWNNKGLENINIENYLDPFYAKELFNLHEKTYSMMNYMLKKAKLKKYPYTVNPCQPSWATVLTKEGIKTIGDLNIGDEIWSETGWTRVINIQSSGIKKVYWYRTTSGKVYCTENHKIIQNGIKVEAAKATSIDILGGPEFEFKELDKQSFIDGLYLGCNFLGKNYFKYTNIEGTTTITKDELLYNNIPDRIIKSSPKIVASVLKGIYSANNYNPDLEVMPDKLAEEIQLMLSSLNIITNKMIIQGKSLICINDKNSAKLLKTLFSIDEGENEGEGEDTGKNIPVSSSIVSVFHYSIEEVFDITVDNSTHTYWSGGHNISNCGEQVLAVYGAYCTLGNVCGTYARTKEEFLLACRLMARFLVRVNQMKIMYSSEIKRTNRIGVSILGIFEFAWNHFKLNLKDILLSEYSSNDVKVVEREKENPGCHKRSKEFAEFISSCRKAVEDSAIEYSKEIKINNFSTFTCIVPGGTVSKVMNSTEGASPPSTNYYLRNIQYTIGSQQLHDLESKGYPVKDVSTSYPGHYIVGFPTKQQVSDIMGDELITASRLTIKEQYDWLSWLEKYWLGGQGNNAQISSTIKYYPENISYKDFQNMLIENQSNVRCCTWMQMLDLSKFAYQPEEEITKEKYEELMNNIKQNNYELLEKEYNDIDLCPNGACPVERDRTVDLDGNTIDLNKISKDSLAAE